MMVKKGWRKVVVRKRKRKLKRKWPGNAVSRPSGGTRTSSKPRRRSRQQRVVLKPSSPRIVVGGMPRSCSSWLFNAIRLLADAAGKPVSLLHVQSQPSKKQLSVDRPQLIKTHQPYPMLKPAFVIVTIRHLLDAIASELCLKSPTMLDNYKKYGITHPFVADEISAFAGLASRWMGVADLVIRYEDIVENKAWYVEQLGEILYPDTNFDVDGIVAELEELPNKVTKRFALPALMGPGHISGVGVGGWKEHLPDDLKEWLVDQYAYWLDAYGYQIDNEAA